VKLSPSSVLVGAIIDGGAHQNKSRACRGDETATLLSRPDEVIG
jgi:hypothetical protein